MPLELENVRLFRDLNSREIERISLALKKETRKKREAVFAEGDAPGWFYIVLEGKIKITKLSPGGREIILEIIAPMDFFGGVAVVRNIPYPANAVAMEDSVLLKMRREDFMEALGRNPGLMKQIFAELGGRLTDSLESRRELALGRVEVRIASLLLKLAKKSGAGDLVNGAGIDMKLTKQDIAEMSGTTVETAIRTMSKFKKAGVLEEKDGRIKIKSMSGLQELISKEE
ncbi:MAG: Crp/Fnr family transcriptional regulator [Nitrospiraceae bacterium]|nr:Crp/Fnr family transcriptional regulator [Nitrospiraceae bacterium]